MADKGELILARIPPVIAGVAGIDEVTRNEEWASGDDKVRVILLDGQELASESDPPRHRSLNLEPRMVILQPEIYILLAAKSADVGTQLRSYRAALIKALLSDATLRSLCRPRGGIRFDGWETDLAAGRLMEGEGRLDMSFEYVMQPNEL